MYKTDYLSMDGHLLRLFLRVYETGSVTRTAEQLGINQSSASHALDRLRRILHDPLFVRAGRGIAPTARAAEIAKEVEELLRKMEALGDHPAYNPAKEQDSFTVMANDYEIETVLKPQFSRFRAAAPQATLRVVPSVPEEDLPRVLRQESVDIAFCPLFNLDSAELKQRKVFSEKYMVFYDARQRSSPKTLAAYCAAPHAVVVLGHLRGKGIDEKLAERGLSRRVLLEAPSFAALAELIRGTDMITTMPSRFSKTLFKGFASCKPPVSLRPFDIIQLWHDRWTYSPRHVWFRGLTTDTNQQKDSGSRREA